MRTIPAVVAAVLLVAAGALAQQPAAPPGAGSQEEATDAAAYVRLAAQADELEVAAGQIALERAQDARVKALAGHIVEDHKQLATQLASLMSGERSSLLPGEGLGGDERQALDRLAAAPAAAFDATFLAMQVESQKAALRVHEAYLRSGTDLVLRKHAEGVANVVQAHLSEAETLATELAR